MPNWANPLGASTSDPVPAWLEFAATTNFFSSLLATVSCRFEGAFVGSVITTSVSKFWPTEALLTAMPPGVPPVPPEVPPDVPPEVAPDPSGLRTVTVATVSGRLGRELACITAVPAAMPVTGIVTLVAFAAKLTEPGTVATLGLSELRLTVKPLAGAGVARINVRFTVWGPVMVTPPGEKPPAMTTCIGCVVAV
jgi:hypothetical protein